MTPQFDWRGLVQELGPTFAARAAAHDAEDRFVEENLRVLKERKALSCPVPTELGGGGLPYPEVCAFLTELARSCPSTALTLSMHLHLVCATVWRHTHGMPGEALLRKVADKQLALVSTGANDWLGSNGTMTRVERGYRVSARKVFCSGAPAGDLLVTSAAFDDPKEGPLVLHFAVPFAADGVRVVETWKAHGMRGTGSHDVVLDDVFVPEETITVRRPRGAFHPSWAVVLTVAMPIIMSVYRGIAETAAARARAHAGEHREEPLLQATVGEMENALCVCTLAVADMVRICDDYRRKPTVDDASATLTRKTIAAHAAIETVEKAMEVVGGAGFYRDFGLERLLRDVRGAHFHPLPEKRQVVFTGRVALGLPPV
jgi:alkylation response protein AidB-like acyl-CoA dehydrogenase